jgi:hypothetical protein
MRVPRGVERSVKQSAFVAAVVAIGIPEEPDVGDAEADDSVLPWEQTNWDIQVVGKDRGFVCGEVAIGVFENADGVFCRGSDGSSEGVFF